jgi:hypothetical protein
MLYSGKINILTKISERNKKQDIKLVSLINENRLVFEAVSKYIARTK